MRWLLSCPVPEMASSTTTSAELSLSETDRLGGPGAGVADQPTALVRHHGGATGQVADAVHLVSTLADYQTWGWPLIQHHGLVQLRLGGEVSATAIPMPISAEVTRILTDRYCAPAVLVHPYAPEHHMVLAGEKFGAPLPWPLGVYQVNGALMLPPTMTIDGPITWVQPPSRDSLRLCREIDVFGALRTALSG